MLYNDDSVPVDLACNPNGGEHIYSQPVYSGYYGLFTKPRMEYYALAQGMSELANAVTGLLGTVFDSVFWACVAAGVTAATAEAVLPAVISGLLGAGQLAKALEAATAITGQIELGTFLVNAFTGLDTQAMDFTAVNGIAALTLPMPGREWIK